MNYFKYLLKNHLWILLGFYGLVVTEILISFRYGAPSLNELKWIGIGVGSITAAFLIGNWIKWRQL